MLLSVNWLRDYVDINMPVDEYCDRIVMTGSNIETCKKIGEGINGVKIGRIIDIQRHPDADRLVICLVDTGGAKPAQVVTGAANVKVGSIVPMAEDGSHIPGPLHGQKKTEAGVVIKSGKLRGVESEGMLCATTELGFDEKVAPMESKDGIWILPEEFGDHIGEEITDAMKLEDYVIDFEITPNRSDCLSMLGMARETAATIGGEIILPEKVCENSDEAASDYISAEIRNSNCRRYTARVIKDVKVEQSPWWLQKRLMAAGMRPINNIVDITNFVMTEYGQPLHAFDIRQISGSKIIVDMAKDNSVFTTLDGTERKLDSTMLMINDEEKPIGLAGIMGGLNSEIMPDTTTVVIESACFDADNIRRTSKKLNLRTDASGRYEKDIDPNLCDKTADRVCALVSKLGCGKPMTGSIDIYPAREGAKTIKVRTRRINKVLGTKMTKEEICGYFQSLDIKTEIIGEDLIVTPPTVRRDLNEEVDYIEEAARMYGYDNIPMTLPECASTVSDDPVWILKRKIGDALRAMEMNEVKTYSFLNQKTLDMAGIPADSWERGLVKIINPMGEDTASVRTILMPGMLEVMGRNYARSIAEVRAFEIGTSFLRNLIDPKGLPDEENHLTLGMYGEDYNFFTLKGIICTLFKEIGVENLCFVAESEYGLFHPGRCARIISKDKHGDDAELGIMGEMHPKVAENFGIETRALGAEIFIDLAGKLACSDIVYRPLPKYPAIERDMALVVDKDLESGSIIEAVKAMDSKIIKDITLFDVYKGKQVEEGKKSLAFNIVYRDDDKTLTDEEVDVTHSEVLKSLADSFGVVLRNIGEKRR